MSCFYSLHSVHMLMCFKLTSDNYNCPLAFIFIVAVFIAARLIRISIIMK